MLSLSSVNLSYAAQDVLHGISLEVMRGEFLSIVGGSGKSSLLKVMGGIEPPQTGHVRYDSVDIYHVNDRKYSEMQQSSGFLFQDAALLANMSMFENVALPLRYHRRMSEQQIRSRVFEVFDILNISIKSDLRPAGFPLSVRKMVAFARAMVLDPEFLFLDDPTGNVDHNSREIVIKTLLDIKCCSKTAAVIVSQDPDLITLTSDRIIVLHGGTIIQDGTVQEVFNSPDERVRDIMEGMGGESDSQSMYVRLEQREGKEQP